MFNILYLHEAWRVSGAENSLFNLALNLERSRFQPIFICPGKGDFAAKLRDCGIKVYPEDFPALRRMLGVLGAIKRIHSVIKEENISLLHSNSIRTHIYASMAAQEKRIPVIWHQRNMLSREIIDPDRLFSFLPALIICNSRAVAWRFRHRGRIPDKVRVVYNGVDSAKFRPEVDGRKFRMEFGIRDDQVVIGMASRFHAIKGHETFFEAARIVLDRRQDFRDKLKFLVAGGAVFEEDKKREVYLRKLVKKLGLEDRVIFAGFRQDMPFVYAAMDIFVLASAAEACGRVVLEAMASAKAVIATNSGGSPEMVIDGLSGYLFKPGDASGLAEKMRLLAQDINQAGRMGVSARQRAVEFFGVEKNARSTERIYLELLGE